MEHEVLCWTGPSLGHLSPSTDKNNDALTVVISDFRGIEYPVWQGRNVSASLPAGARRGFLAVEDFQSVLVACGNRVSLDLQTDTTLACVEKQAHVSLRRDWDQPSGAF